MSCPASMIFPLVGSSRPATIRSVVVLPQPEAPSRAKNEPCGTVRLRWSTAVNAPNCLVTLINWRSLPPDTWSCMGSGSDQRLELLLVRGALRLVQRLEGLELGQRV